MKKLLSFILLFLHCSLAQEKKETSPFSLKLLCVSSVKNAESLIIAEQNGEDWHAKWKVKVAANTISDAMGLANRKLCIALDPTPTGNSDFTGPAIPVKTPLVVKPLQTFELPAGDTTMALLLAAPAAEQAKGKPYRIVLLDVNSQNFSNGKVLVQNFSSSVIGCNFGGKGAKIQPGETSVITPGINAPGDMSQITLAKQENTQWKPFCDTRWEAKVDYRRYLLIIPRGDGGLNPFMMTEHPPYK